MIGLSLALIPSAAYNSTIDSISMKALQARQFHAALKLEKRLVQTESYRAMLMSYYSDGLKLFTLVNMPISDAPADGFPVLIFGHGFHPEPKKYGTNTQTGKDWRPGDYYRGIPESYAKQGFLVLTPDYRGHNKSEGFAYTRTKYLASSYYAVDILHLIAALPSLKNSDLNNIYYLGHSLGGEVGLKVILASSKIKAASLWSPVIATTYEQALYYGKYHDKKSAMVTLASMKEYMREIDNIYVALPFQLSSDEVDPINFIDDISTPLIIHHAKEDASVPYIWSESLVAKLFKYGKEFEFYEYDSDHHLFQSEDRVAAIRRDITFFKNLVESR